jgi:hypothetical protein
MRILHAAKLLVGSWIVLGACVATWGACGGSKGSGGLGGNAGGKGSGGHGGGVMPSANADEGGSRLKANIIKGSDGSKHYIGTFHDTMRNEDCSFRPAVDGKTRCLPDAVVVGPFFGDAACTMPLVSAPSACANPSYGSKISSCGLGEDLFKIGPKATGTIYNNSSGTCMAVTMPPPALNIFTIGAEQPPGGFVLGTSATE